MKSSIDNQYHNYPVAYLDHDRLVSLYGSDPFVTQTTDMPAAITWAQTMYGAGVNLNYFVIGDSPSGGFTSGLLSGCMQDLVKPENSKANPVSITVQSTGVKAETGHAFADCFTLQGYSAGAAPPSDLNTSNRYYTAVTVSDHDKYNQTQTYSPPVTYSVNDRLSAKLETTTGNTIGCCIGIGGSENKEFVCVGNPYIDSSEVRYGSNLDWSPAVQDNRDGFGDGGWMLQCNYGGGSFVPGYNSNPYALSGDSPYHTDDPKPYVLNQVTVQFVYTVVSSQLYIGLACLRWSGNNVLSIYADFLPAWFWGEYTLTDPELTPATKENYYGTDAQPAGGNGEYSYTNDPVDLPTALQPFGTITSDGHGMHIYDISISDYEEVCGTLWGDGTLTSALWKKWQNFKCNPIAAVIGCHQIPTDLRPSTAGMTQVDPRAAGCPLTTSKQAYYVNTKTTIDFNVGDMTIPKYYGHFMDYEPYTDISLFLPFCGWMTVSPDRVNGGAQSGKINVKYRCDIITGNVAAYVKTYIRTAAGTYIQTGTQTATGNCAVEIPVTGNDNGTGTVLGAVTAAAGVAAAGIAGGAGGAMIGGAAAAGLGIHAGRHNIQQAGNYSGNIAMINQLQCFASVTMPIAVYTDIWKELHGLKSGLAVTVSQLTGTGFTQFSDFHADLDCTEAEQAEIEEIMKTGVIL